MSPFAEETEETEGAFAASAHVDMVQYVLLTISWTSTTRHSNYTKALAMPAATTEVETAAASIDVPEAIAEALALPTDIDIPIRTSSHKYTRVLLLWTWNLLFWTWHVPLQVVAATAVRAKIEAAR